MGEGYQDDCSTQSSRTDSPCPLWHSQGQGATISTNPFDDLFNIHVPNRTAFLQQLLVEFTKCRAVLKDYPKLLLDFQFVLDRHGTIFVIWIWIDYLKLDTSP